MTHEAVKQIQDIWRVELVDMETPAKVPLMTVQLKPGAKPYCCKARHYSQLHRQYMLQITQAMLAGKFIKRTQAATWAVNAVVVTKNGVPQRVCGDYKLINVVTQKTVWPMPNLVVIMEHLNGKRFFFVINLFKGYWQFLLDVLHPKSKQLRKKKSKQFS